MMEANNVEILYLVKDQLNTEHAMKPMSLYDAVNKVMSGLLIL